jgi:hypothetical protein
VSAGWVIPSLFVGPEMEHGANFLILYYPRCLWACKEALLPSTSATETQNPIGGIFELWLTSWSSDSLPLLKLSDAILSHVQGCRAVKQRPL